MPPFKYPSLSSKPQPGSCLKRRLHWENVFCPFYSWSLLVNSSLYFGLSFSSFFNSSKPWVHIKIAWRAFKKYWPRLTLDWLVKNLGWEPWTWFFLLRRNLFFVKTRCLPMVKVIINPLPSSRDCILNHLSFLPSQFFFSNDSFSYSAKHLFFTHPKISPGVFLVQWMLTRHPLQSMCGWLQVLWKLSEMASESHTSKSQRNQEKFMPEIKIDHVWRCQWKFSLRHMS